MYIYRLGGWIDRYIDHVRTIMMQLSLSSIPNTANFRRPWRGFGANALDVLVKHLGANGSFLVTIINAGQLVEGRVCGDDVR